MLKLEGLKRYRDIILFLLKYGRTNLFKEFDAEIDLPPETSLEKRADKSEYREAEELTNEIQKMGPTFIKLGQLLSTQSDIIKEPYEEAFSELQDKVAPFPYEEAKAIIESELGVEIKVAFERFDQIPFASASLSQVHYAILRSGKEVAVKIQRPHIQKLVLEDLEILQNIAALLDKNSIWKKKYHFAKKIQNLQKTLIDELDFLKEAKNLIHFKKNLEEFENIVIPAPIMDYTTSKVLTMEYIPGTNITKLDPVIILETSGNMLVEELFRAYLKQFAIDGFVHVDPHPGNVYLYDNNKIAILDLGMVTFIPPMMQNKLLKFFLAVSEGNGEDASEILLELGDPAENANLHSFQEKVSNLVAQYRDTTLGEISTGKLVLKLNDISNESGILLPNQISLLGKTLLNLDRIGKILAPDFNPNACIRENIYGLLTERVKKNLTEGSISRSILDLNDFFHHLPSRITRLLDLVSQNKIKIKVDTIDETRLMQGFQKIANRITTGLVLAALIVGGALLMPIQTSFTLWEYPGIAILLFLGAAIGGVILIIYSLFFDVKETPKDDD